MARAKDLWWTTGKRGEKHKTARHPDSAGDDKERRKQLQDAKRYLAEWRDPSGHIRTKAFANQKTAKAYADDKEADARHGEYIDPAAGQVLIDPLARKWLRLREVGASSATRYESCYRIHVAPVFGQRQAGGVKPSEVAEWSRTLAGRPATRHLALVILTGIFDLAVADKARRDNPARSSVVAKPKRQRAVRADPWDAARILAVAAACGVHESAVLIAAGLGLRQGEDFGLGLEDFDLGAEVVHIRRQVARVAGTGYVFKLPKGGKERTVPLPRGVAALVSSKVKADIPTRVTLPWLNEDGSHGKPVTVQLLGGPPMPNTSWDRQVWKPALVAAGVIPAYTGRRYAADGKQGMHALRHWYSTHLLDNGVSLAAVMEFMGHSRESVPLAIGVYGHVTPEAYERARQVVDQALFRPRLVTSDGTATERKQARHP